MASDNIIAENVIVAFVDTSAIDPMFNDYNNMEHQFVALKKHIASNKLILLTHEIAVREMESHIREEVTKQIEKYTNIQNSRELVLLKNVRRYTSLFSGADKEKIIADTTKSLKTKLKDIGILVLKTGTISVKALLDDYFFLNPPFGEKGKKSEFPDAIMFQSLMRSIGEEHRLHIIAKDGDWENVCKTRKTLVYHKGLANFLDYINKDNVASSAIKTYLTKAAIAEQIKLKLKEIIEIIDFKVDGLTYDRKGLVEGYSYDKTELLRVSDIGYFIHTIEDIDCSRETEDSTITAIVTIVGSAHITLECSYFDEANSIWDREDHEYIYKEYGRATEIHEFLFPVRLTLSGDYKANLEITDYTLIETEEFAALNSGTLIDREYISDYYDLGFHVDKILSCPYCNKDVKVDLISDGTDCVSLTERQMGIEREYCVDVVGICPHCLETYRITGEVWEYPENCCNLEQNIKISKET